MAKHTFRVQGDLEEARRLVSDAPDIEILNGISQSASLPLGGGELPGHIIELLVSVDAPDADEARARVDAVLPSDRFEVYAE